MSANSTEPNGWELKRGLDQFRSDVRDDLADLKSDVAGVAGRLDAMDQRYVTHREYAGVVGRVEKLEQGAEKRTDRTITIWLGIGGVALTALISIVLGLIQLLGK